MKIHQYTMLCASNIAQEAATESLNNPETDINYMKAEYRRRRNFIYNSFTEMNIPCAKPHGAFYIFPQIQQFGISSKDFALRLLEQEKVAVVPGAAFGSSGEGHIRCAYATSMEELERAMEHIDRFIKNL